MFLFLVKQIIAIDNFVAIIYITFLNSDLTAILNLYIIYSMYGFIWPLTMSIDDLLTILFHSTGHNSNTHEKKHERSVAYSNIQASQWPE
mgnify:CR=1 FL=1